MLGTLRPLTARVAIPALIVCLKDEDDSVRWESVFTLSKLGERNVIPILITYLKHADADIRKKAVSALRRLEAKEAIPAIKTCLKDEDLELRESAVEVLGLLGASEIIPDLIDFMKSKTDSSMKYAAVSTLAQLNATQVIPDLIEFIKDKTDVNMRYKAVCALDQLNAQDAISELKICLKDEDVIVRLCAMHALGKTMSTNEVVPIFISYLDDEDFNVRNNVVIVLGRLDAKTAIPNLITCLDDREESVRASAVYSLGQLEAKDAIITLRKVAKDDQFREIRILATGVLACLGEKVDISNLPELLDFGYMSQQVQGCSLLVKLKIKSAIPAIQELQTDDNWYIRQIAKAAIKQLQDLPDTVEQPLPPTPKPTDETK